MTVDPRVQRLALLFLSDYDLTNAERLEESERLAQSIQTVIEAELESLAHRRRA